MFSLKPSIFLGLNPSEYALPLNLSVDLYSLDLSAGLFALKPSEGFKPRNIEGFKENKPREGVEKDYRRKRDREKPKFFSKKSKDFKNRNFNAGNKNKESFN